MASALAEMGEARLVMWTLAEILVDFHQIGDAAVFVLGQRVDFGQILVFPAFASATTADVENLAPRS
jgi:hypothetical protein